MCTENIKKLNLQVYEDHGEAQFQGRSTKCVGKSLISIVTDFGLCTLIDVGLCCLVGDVDQIGMEHE